MTTFRSVEDYLREDNLRLYAAMIAVKKLHNPKELSLVWTGCEICWEHPKTRGSSYPCATIKAIDAALESFDKEAYEEALNDDTTEA